MDTFYEHTFIGLQSKMPKQLQNAAPCKKTHLKKAEMALY